MKVAMVTGGGNGVGRCAAFALVQDGYSVVITGRRAGALEEVRRTVGDAAERVSSACPPTSETRKPSARFSRRGRSASGVSTSFSTMPSLAGLWCPWKTLPIRTGWQWSRSTDRHVPMYAGGDPDDADADTDGRVHHQQRLGLDAAAFFPTPHERCHSRITLGRIGMRLRDLRSARYPSPATLDILHELPNHIAKPAVTGPISKETRRRNE